jgi:hypothetical protein
VVRHCYAAPLAPNWVNSHSVTTNSSQPPSPGAVNKLMEYHIHSKSILIHSPICEPIWIFTYNTNETLTLLKPGITTLCLCNLDPINQSHDSKLRLRTSSPFNLISSLPSLSIFLQDLSYKKEVLKQLTNSTQAKVRFHSPVICINNTTINNCNCLAFFPEHGMDHSSPFYAGNPDRGPI